MEKPGEMTGAVPKALPPALRRRKKEKKPRGKKPPVRV
jgi:hypothetical protein